jgi:hypothetical protein
MYACGAYIYMSLVDSSMESAALLACTILPYFLFNMQAGQ